MFDSLLKEYTSNVPFEATARASRDGAFFLRQANQILAIACLEYGRRPVLPPLISFLRMATQSIHQAFRFRANATELDLWVHFLTSVALNEKDSAQFLASVPIAYWSDGSSPLHLVEVAQNLVAFALFRQERRTPARLLEQLKAFVSDASFPSSIASRIPELQNTASLLSAIHERNAQQFNTHLTQRLALRRKTMDPHGPLDLAGLGLCCLARMQGISPFLKHVSLPLELLKLR